METAEITGLIRQAEEWLLKARSAVGNEDRANAVYNLERALPLVKGALKAVKP